MAAGLGRLKFLHEGRVIYEWEQSLTEVNVYVETPALPSGPLRGQDMRCDIGARRVRLGLRKGVLERAAAAAGQPSVPLSEAVEPPLFLDAETWSTCVEDESCWMLEDSVVEEEVPVEAKVEDGAGEGGEGKQEEQAVETRKVRRQKQEVCITLYKAAEGEMWEAVFKGHEGGGTGPGGVPVAAAAAAGAGASAGAGDAVSAVPIGGPAPDAEGASAPGAGMDEFTKQEIAKQLMRERFQAEHPGFDFSGAEFNGSVPNAREFMGGISHR